MVGSLRLVRTVGIPFTGLAALRSAVTAVSVIYSHWLLKFSVASQANCRLVDVMCESQVNDILDLRVCFHFYTSPVSVSDKT